MAEVFKEKDYQPETPVLPPLESFLISGLEGLRSDFGNVIEATKKFPIRSALTTIGFITVLYIGFKVSNKFVKI